MSIFKELFDTVKDVRSEFKGGVAGDFLGKKRYSSIAKQSSEGILQFPVLVSRSLEMETAQMVSKALERQYATFMQVVISMNPYLDLTKDKDVAEYLRKYHQNSGVKFNPLTDITFEGMTVLSDENDNALMFAVSEGSSNRVMANNRESMYNIQESLRTKAVNDLYTPKNTNVNFSNSSVSNYYNKPNYRPLTEKTVSTMVTSDDGTTKRTTTEDPYKKLQYDETIRKNKYSELGQRVNYSLSKDKFKLDEKGFDLKKGQRDDQLKQFDAKHKIDQAKLGLDERKMAWDREKFEKGMRTEIKLSDNDVKKSNELVPTTLSVTLNTKDVNGFGPQVNFILGIKTLMHPVSSDEMVKNMVAGCKNNNNFFNFVRWTSGEISFFKDFMFNIDQIKDDVYSRSTGSTHWWNTLKRRKSLAGLKNKTFTSKRILPNASVAITLEELEYIRSTYGFDLMNSTFVNKIMKEYFLLGFVVVDASMEVCHFMFDGQNDFQTLSFKGLEKENNSKNDFKDMYKLINSGRL